MLEESVLHLTLCLNTWSRLRILNRISDDELASALINVPLVHPTIEQDNVVMMIVDKLNVMRDNHMFSLIPVVKISILGMKLKLCCVALEKLCNVAQSHIGLVSIGKHLTAPAMRRNTKVEFRILSQIN